MFITFGKMLGKTNIGVGFRMKLNSKNIFWMSIVALFYYMFKLMWFCMILSAWLIYAMFYGMWWCIKKIFGIGKGAVNSNISKPSKVINSKNKGLPDSNMVNASSVDSAVETSNYAKAVFLWGNSKPSPIKKRAEYPQYLFYECGIQDAAKFHKQMLTEGYLEQASMEAMLSTLKVGDIKEILKSNDLPVTGKKQELIDRILNSVPQEKLAELVSNDGVYSISDLGKKYIADNDICIQVHTHQNWGIKWKDIEEILQKNPTIKFYDACWNIFNKRLLECADSKSLARNEYFNMYQLHLEKGQNVDALRMLLVVFYFDISGLDYGTVDLYKNKILKKKDLINKFESEIFFAPAIIKSIGDLYEYYDLSMIDNACSFDVPFNACNKNLFKSIVESIINGSFDENYAKEQLKKGYTTAVNKL